MTSPAPGRVATIKAATIKDVAALAGVSWKTVTNVVHERTNVAPATRARVLAAIEELDYRPDIAGRSLRQGRSHAVTLVFTMHHGAEATTRLVTADAGIDGLVCANDLLAFGALHSLRRVGRRVPEDVAVTGWDDTLQAAYSNPTLTSVRPDLGALAAAAVGRLIDRIEQPGGPPESVVVPYEIVMRESTERR